MTTVYGKWIKCSSVVYTEFDDLPYRNASHMTSIALAWLHYNSGATGQVKVVEEN